MMISHEISEVKRGSLMPTLKIRNWGEFQQYKDRCPPWIKLHREILQSEDWVMWDDASRVLAVACMLLASRTVDGTLPANPDYIKRAAYLNCEPNLQPLIDCGFLELNGADSIPYKTLASRTTETETETETEEREGGQSRTGGTGPGSKNKNSRTIFVPPSLGDLQEYIAEKNYHFDAESFLAFYESKGWMVGKNKMKSWQAACRTWEQRWKQEHPGQQQGHSQSEMIGNLSEEEYRAFLHETGNHPIHMKDVEEWRVKRGDVPF